MFIIIKYRSYDLINSDAAMKMHKNIDVIDRLKMSPTELIHMNDLII